MCIFYFDSGTTNTRGYLICDKGKIVSRKIPFGSKDVSANGNRDIFALELKKLYDRILSDEGIGDDRVKSIYASGMVTSPYGFCEVPHLLLPVDAVKLRKHMYPFQEDRYFRRTIHLIRGTKTVKGPIPLKTIDQVNNTRGEEIEAIGIAADLSPCWRDEPYIVLIPGSHTHAALMENRRMDDVWSMFSGELFYSLTNATVLASEVEKDSDITPDMEIVLKGCEYLSKYGLARALYIVHASRIFETGDNLARRDLLNGIIIGNVIQSLKIVMDTKWPATKKLVIYGNPDIVKQHAAAAHCFMPHVEIKSLEAAGAYMEYSVRGLLEIITQGEEQKWKRF